MADTWPMCACAVLTVPYPKPDGDYTMYQIRLTCMVCTSRSEALRRQWSKDG